MGSNRFVLVFVGCVDFVVKESFGVSLMLRLGLFRLFLVIF